MKDLITEARELCADGTKSGNGGDGMRIDLLEKWLKEYPYGYCNGINFQTCRANQNDSCPYCTSNVHCSDGHAALEYYREMLRYMRMKPRKARKVAIAFAESLPSIMQSLDAEIEKIIAARKEATP